MNRSPSGAGGRVSEVCFKKTCARGLGHSAYFTIRILWEMREHEVISLDSLTVDFPAKLFYLAFLHGGLSRIGFDGGRFLFVLEGSPHLATLVERTIPFAG